MRSHHFVGGYAPERFIEVDAARLLLILAKFAIDIDEHAQNLFPFPQDDIVKQFTPEYLLQKLDFLVRNPGYLAYELVELYRLGETTTNEAAVIQLVREILSNKEPDLNTIPYRKFWRGAYDRLDDVESYWCSRRLVYIRFEHRGNARPQKHYLLTVRALDMAKQLVDTVDHASWYSERIENIHLYFGRLSPSRITQLQYQHEPYRLAALNGMIPNLPLSDIVQHFEDVFKQPLKISNA